jgi:flagellar hook-length control protein FliK
VAPTVAAASQPIAAPQNAATPARKGDDEYRNDSRQTLSQTKPASTTTAAAATSSVTRATSKASHDSASGGGAAAPAAAVSATADVAAPAATVALADVPAFLDEQASSLTTAAAPDAAASTASTASAPRTTQAVKELKISLDPADLGEMTVKLRLADGKLSVSIAVANPTTLGAIEDDRDVIAARLAGAGQTLENLVISRQAPSTPEISHASTDRDASAGDDGAPQDGYAKPRSGRRGGGAGGGFSDLMV